MKYCPWCQILGGETCKKCRRPNREPEKNDPVLLATVDYLHAEMIGPIFDEAKIPCSRQGELSGVMSMMGGMRLENVRVYVPFGAYRRARLLLADVFSGDRLVMNGLEPDWGEE